MTTEALGREAEIALRAWVKAGPLWRDEAAARAGYVSGFSAGVLTEQAREPDEAAREAIIRRIAAALAIQFPWTIEVVMPLARAAYEASRG